MSEAVESTATLALEVCAPDNPVATLEVVEVVLPGELGEFTVLPGHTPLLSTLLPGLAVAIDSEGSEHVFAVSTGFAQVLDNRVVLLLQSAEAAADIDQARAEHAKQRAEERLSQRGGDMDVKRAQLALRRALSRLDARERHGL